MAAGDSTQFDPVTFLAAHGIRGEAGPVRATGGAATTRVVLRVLVSAWQSGYRRAGGVIPGRRAMAPWVAWAARWIAAEAVGREGPSTPVATSARRWVASWQA